MARYLGGRWAQAGHEVCFGSRSEDKAQEIAKEIGRGTRGASNDDAAEFADVILLTVRKPPREFLTAPEALDGKVLIDLNNQDFPRNTAWDGIHPSLAEAVQKAHPRTRVVKAFNTMAVEVFAHEPEELRQLDVSTFLAGDDEEALAVVANLAREVGLNPWTFGPLSESWILEVQADFIRTLMFSKNSPMITTNCKAIPEPRSDPFGGRKKGSY